MAAFKTADVVGSIVKGAFGLGGSAMESHAAGEAAKSQERAAMAALAYEKERDAAKQRQWEADQRRLAPYRMGAASVLAKYGIDVPLDNGAPEPSPSGPQAIPRVPMTLGDFGAQGYGR